MCNLICQDIHSFGCKTVFVVPSISFQGMNRLGTGSLSSNTLQRGMELAAQPLVNILGVKEEPTDEDEAEMQAEIQVGIQPSI